MYLPLRLAIPGSKTPACLDLISRTPELPPLIAPYRWANKNAPSLFTKTNPACEIFGCFNYFIFFYVQQLQNKLGRANPGS